MSSSDCRVFWELDEGAMFRHVGGGRLVEGVLRKRWHVSAEDCGNAEVVATGERWVFPGEAGVVEYDPGSESERVLALMPVWLWPQWGAARCEECGVRAHCRGLVATGDMSLCEAVVVAQRAVDGGRRRARRRRPGVIDRRAAMDRLIARSSR